jgi:ATP-dependent Clp protease adaptor protein ClpS
MTDKDKKQDGGSGQIILESRTQTKKPSMYKVVMMNDDYTPMEFVVHVLQHFFGRTVDEATQIMLNVHQHGVGICGIYSFEIAETKASKTMEYARQKEHPLQLQLEKE